MYIYFIIFLIILLSSYIFHKAELNNNIVLRRNYCIGVAIVLVLLSGLRHESIGLDTVMYKYIYYDIRAGSDSLIVDDEAEIGFFYLMKYFGLYFDYQIFLILVASLSIIPVSFIIYTYSRNVCLSFLIFYSSILFHALEFAAERQAIAFGFVVIAYHFIMQRKLILYLSCLAIGFLFHKSCFVFLPCYWLYNLEICKRTVIFLGISLAISFATGTLIFSYVVKFWRIEYGLSEEDAGGERLFFLLCVFAYIGLSFYKDYNNNINVRLPLLIFSLSPLIWPVLNINPALYRLQYYFDFFLALYVPNYLYISANGKIRKIICFLSAFLMIYVLFKMRTAEAYYPYKFFWE